ncbi:MAG TPA: carbohydrate ABC transporter permease [Nocardioidaceae bacterium]|nr:carbohydrate ABC transporter permease [Nocardioidaceae bacterium]
MSRRTSSRILVALGCVAVLVFSLFPVFIMLSTAVDARANDGSTSLLPTQLTWDNFAFVLDEGGFTRYLLNSLFVGLATVLLSGLLALLASVAVSRFVFRFRTAILVLVLVIQMVPLEAMVIPLFIQAKTLGMLNHLLGLVIVYVAFSLPFAIWMLRGFVAAVPREVEEAAYVDGASWPRMFWSVLLPLCAPGLVATSVFSFITAWNEFVFAITFMNDQDSYTVAAGLRQFFTQYGTDWGSVMAGSTLITLPVMIFFILVQRRLSAGLVAGAVKG